MLACVLRRATSRNNIMTLRHAGIVASLLALGALAAPLASAADEVRIFVETAPPAAKVSVAPSPARVGYVWSPGYWNWSGSAYVWTEGTWIAVAEPTKKWIAPTWTQEGNKWYFTAGHWG
jgi:hypothetical protein